MNYPGMPPYGRPEFDQWYEDHYGQRPPHRPLTGGFPGGSPGGMPGRGGRPDYDSEDEDGGYGRGRGGGRGGQGGPEELMNRLMGHMGQEGHGGMDPYGGNDDPRRHGMRPPRSRGGGFPGMPPRRPGGMPGHGGRPGYSSEDQDEGFDELLESSIERLMAHIRQGGHGGEDPYGRDDGPRRPNMRPRHGY